MCRYRLVVDESLALGVLGQHGRGACEHWGLSPGDAEVVSASMGALCFLVMLWHRRVSQQTSVQGRGCAARCLLALCMSCCGQWSEMCTL